MQNRRLSGRNHSTSWSTEWFVIFLRAGTVLIYPSPTSHTFWHGLQTQQFSKKFCCIDAWMGERIWPSIHVVFLCQCSSLPGPLPGSSSPCWPWDLGGPPWAGWGAPQVLPAAHCRRSGARSGWDKSQMSPADSQWAGNFLWTCPCWGRMARCSQNGLDLERRPVSHGNFWLLFRGYIPSQQGPRQDSDLGPIYLVCWLFLSDLGSSLHLSLVSPALCPEGQGPLQLSGFWLCLADRRYQQEVGEWEGGEGHGDLPATLWPPWAQLLLRRPSSGSSSHWALVTLPLPFSLPAVRASLCCWHLSASASLSGSLTLLTPL